MSVTIDTYGKSISLRQGLSNIVIDWREVDEIVERLEAAQHEVRIAELNRMKRERRARRDTGVDTSED